MPSQNSTSGDFTPRSILALHVLLPNRGQIVTSFDMEPLNRSL
jgi:hypothetical protein